MRTTYHLCEECGSNSLHTRPSFSPWLGLALTGLSCGLFIIPWTCISIWQQFQPWKCETCGLSTCLHPDGFVRVIEKPRFSVWRVMFGVLIGMAIAAIVIWDDERHSRSFLSVGIALGAGVILIAVRIINRGEPWAKWAAITVLALAGYSLSSGPASRLALKKGSHPRAIQVFETVYLPLNWLANHGPTPIRRAMRQYFDLWN